MTTYRLLIAIEHALPNWPLVDFRKKELRKGVVCSRVNMDAPRHHLSQGNGFFGTDFLAAKAYDTNVRVHLGKAVTHGQSRYRTLIDTGAAGCAQLRISLRL